MKLSNITHTILVVGSTGATGKHVVQMLLDRGDTKVVAVARSESKLKGLLRNGEQTNIKNLDIKESSIGQMSVDELKDLTKECTAIVSCLGHNMTFKGMFCDGLFISQSVKKLTKVMPKTCRFVLMGTDGFSYPDGSDAPRTLFERGILNLLRCVLPPVEDNELSAKYLLEEAKSKNKKCYEWVIARPGDLVDEDETVLSETSKKDYEIFDHTSGALFGDQSTTRTQVAHFMTDLATMDSKEAAFQKTYNHKMPVVYSRVIDRIGTTN